MKKTLRIIAIICVMFSCIIITGCKEKELTKYCDITYEANGGQLESLTQRIEVGMIAGLMTPTRDNYTFLGWYKSSDFRGDAYFNYAPSDSETITLYAKWEIKIDYDKVTNTKALINKLVKIIELDDEAKILEARSLYDSLKPSEKSLVTNYAELEKAELSLSSLKQIARYKEKAQVVIDLIDNIGEVIDENEEENINNAKDAYNNLSNPVKQYVTNYDKLKECMKKLEDFMLNQMYADAKDMNVMIAKIPSIVSYTDKDYINEVKSAYDELRNDAKKYVNLYYKLENAINTISEIENSVNTITYVLGNSVYTSRDQLFTAFMSDFYYFINANFGSVTLETRDIKSCDDFISFASNYSAGRGEMRAIGDEFAGYYLTKDINGIMENQPSSTYLGYCLQNNKYHDFIDFLSRFFAYWRIDEKYANLNNYGADLYAESWAALVDTCKFFYFTKDTCYVKSERMMDCYDFTQSVVYGELPTILKQTVTLPTDIKLRGYKFSGWYDNPNYEGEKITTVQPGKKVILYAKWEIDETSQAIDNAKKTEVYIYNLTTSKANITAQTICYVRKMYDELSEIGKANVSNYNDLVRIENNFTEVQQLSCYMATFEYYCPRKETLILC